MQSFTDVISLIDSYLRGIGSLSKCFDIRTSNRERIDANDIFIDSNDLTCGVNDKIL